LVTPTGRAVRALPDYLPKKRNNPMIIDKLTAASFALLMTTAVAAAQTKTAPAKPALKAAATVVAPVGVSQAAVPVPASDVLLMMIRGHAFAVGQAIQTSNFEVVRSLGSAGFRSKSSNVELQKTFAELAALKLDMSPVLIVAPLLTEPPVVTRDNKLRLVGVFATKPVELPFGMLFEVEEGRWKLGDISVGARAAPSEAVVALPLDSVMK
jgi:hypothetical protein